MLVIGNGHCHNACYQCEIKKQKRNQNTSYSIILSIDAYTQIYIYICLVTYIQFHPHST
jgi:hypothetical protein